jgi:protein O-mannosyl-transferase
VMLPVIVLIAERAFFRQRWRDAFRTTLPYLVTLLGLILLMSYVQFPHGNTESRAGILHTLDRYYREGGFTLTEQILTQCRVLFSYLSIIIAPLPDRVQLISLQGESRSLFSPPETFAAVVGVVCLVAGSLYLLKKRPLSGFGLCFYWVNLIPESLLVPQYAFFAYRAALPMLGIYLVLMDLLMAVLAPRRDWARRTMIRTGVCGFLVCAVILMGLATMTRSSIWGDEVRFWGETIARFPNTLYKGEARVASQAFTNLGTALNRRGRYEEAISYYDKALALVPTYAAALAARGSAYAKAGYPEDAEASLRKAIEADPNFGFAHEHLGRLLESQSRYEEALRHLQRAKELTAKTVSWE